MLLASMLIAAGLAISALALTALITRDPLQIAQATPAYAIDARRGNEAVRAVRTGTTGQRPSDIPPQPARPDPDAQKAGAQPALPPAPAEKVAPPIREK